MSGPPDPAPPLPTPAGRRGPGRRGLRSLSLALGVFLGGVGMTAAWIALFFTGAREPAPAAAPRDPVVVKAPARRVLWLVLDAMRQDAAFDASLMPNLAALRATGTWGVARTGTFTMTGTCVRALGTGMPPTPTHVIHNFRSPPIEADNLFRRVHRAGRRIVLIGDHIWTDLYRMTVTASHPQPDLGVEDVDRTDRAAFADALRVLPGGWDLAVVHFVGSDHAAHVDRGVTGQYRRKLAEYDAWIPKLRARMGPDVTLLVMADHACNRVGSHGAGEAEATRAPYVLSGPGVRALGRRDIEQTALASTLTALLGAPAPWGAERPGLLEALDVSPAERARLALNHAHQRVAHLRALGGTSHVALARRLAAAEVTCSPGAPARCEREGRQIIAAATAARHQAERPPVAVWVAAFSFLFTLPLLLLAAGVGPGPDPRWLLGGLVLLLGTLVAIFVGLGPWGAPLAAAVVAGLALGEAWPHRREAWLRHGLLASGLLWLLVLLASFGVDLLQRAGRGDPVGWLRAAPAGLVLVGLMSVWTYRRPGPRLALLRAPAPLLALAAAALFLPLPALRWWGGRHALFAGVALVTVGGVSLWAWRRRGLSLAVAVGAGAAVVLLGLGLFLGIGAPAGPPRAGLAWGIALVTPALYAGLGLPEERRAWPAAALALVAWGVAHVPRFAGLGHEAPLLLGVLGIALGLALFAAAGRAALLLCFVALFRLLAGDGPTLLVALFGAALLGFGHLRLAASGVLGRMGLVLGMTLWELALFSLLGRELSFDTIDVNLGFVGGGGLDLVRITLLVLLAYALPWWMLWVAVAPGLAPTPGRLEAILTLALWVLAVKVLGTFLLFLGRPAHFWLIHSLIPFQFFSLAHVLVVAAGYGWARRLGRPA